MYIKSNETEKRFIDRDGYLILRYDAFIKCLNIVSDIKMIDINLIKRTSIHLCDDILNILNKISLNGNN